MCSCVQGGVFTLRQSNSAVAVEGGKMEKICTYTHTFYLLGVNFWNSAFIYLFSIIAIVCVCLFEDSHAGARILLASCWSFSLEHRDAVDSGRVISCCQLNTYTHTNMLEEQKYTVCKVYYTISLRF